MKNRCLILMGLSVVLCTMTVPGLVAQESRPNVIVILADDLGFSDTQPFGAEIETPNLMRLAKEGIRFTQFHNCAKCSPTRASLLTGLYPQQVNMAGLAKESAEDKTVNTMGEGDLSRKAVTIAEALKPAGYTSYISGKWHLTTQFKPVTEAAKFDWPLQRGFDHYFGFIEGAVKTYFNTRNLVIDNAFLSESQLPKEYYITDIIADRACGFIADQAKNQSTKPFFMYVAFNAPHWPVMAKPEDVAHYKGKYAMGWDELRKERFARQKELGIFPVNAELSLRNEEVPAWDKITPEQKALAQSTMETYAAMITCMDQGVGRILETLEKNQMTDNTLVLFLSDNGACAEGGTETSAGTGKKGRLGPGWANVGNTPFPWWKNTTWEGGSATQMIARWPKGIASALNGGFSRDVGHVVDLMPTFIELSGATYPKEYQGNAIQPMKGKSLVPVFQGKSLGERKLFWKYGSFESVHVGDWKMTREKKNAWQLFNLGKDPSEMYNLAASNPEKVKTLEVKWQAWADQVNVGKKDKKKGKKPTGKASGETIE